MRPTCADRIQWRDEVLRAAGFSEEAILYEMYLSKEPAEVFERFADLGAFGQCAHRRDRAPVLAIVVLGLPRLARVQLDGKGRVVAAEVVDRALVLRLVTNRGLRTTIDELARPGRRGPAALRRLLDENVSSAYECDSGTGTTGLFSIF